MPQQANPDESEQAKDQTSDLFGGLDAPEASPASTSSKFARRRFIGWSKPVLAAASELLFAEFHKQGQWDLRDIVVVLPSSLACRRLSEMLAVEAEAKKVVLFPPQILTVGALPETLYIAKQPFASQHVQYLAWKEVLQATPAHELAHIVPVPPPASNTIQWVELGRTIANIHRELAADGLTFKAVVHHLKRTHPEHKRWEVLADVQRRYLEKLDELQLWDIQTARLFALDYHEAETSKNIIALACVDLNHTQRGFLEAVANRVEIWIAAEQESSALFDDAGCLVSKEWQNRGVDVPADQLYVGNTPVDQAELCVASVAELGDRFHARDITLGVPEQSLIPELRRQFDLAGVSVRYGPGNSVALAEPTVLLSLIGKYVEQRTFAAFAELIRHPAVANLLRQSKSDLPEDWLSEIDRYYQEALPKQVDGYIYEQAPGAKSFQRTTKVIDRWLGRLSKRPQPIAAFVQPLLNILSAAYQRIECDQEDPIEGPLWSAAQALSASILELRDIPEELQPTVTATELIDFLLNSLRSQLVPEVPDPESIEMLGWLELAFDDTPVLVVAGMHDGVVPESTSSDAFLPNTLRRQLGMIDNDRRYARDMYALQIMLTTREEVRFVVGKLDASGDPLTPSRLLMACPLRQLPGRVLHLVQEDKTDVAPRVRNRWSHPAAKTQLSIPVPEQAEQAEDVFGPIRAPQHITVTAFRDYLACPYRFYLRHVRKLRSEDDAPEEMGARQFGNLVHDTLAELKGPIAKSTDASEIEAFLLAELDALAGKIYGPQPAAPVLIQIEQAELRLRVFAERQAEHAANGWEIKFVETGVDREDQLQLGHKMQMPLVGRIDRIDFNARTGEWAIWDYKTSESAKNPVSVHWTKHKGWADLQLPLYRHIAARMGVEGEPTLGYIALPKQAADIGFHPAEFSKEQLAEADRLAHEVAEKVANCEYWPEEIGEVTYDDYARICQVNARRVTVSAPQPKVHRTHERDFSEVPMDVVEKAVPLLANPQVSRPDLPPLLIRASAGTGKTFQLSNRLLQIILAGQDVDGILATTFTRKAAGEIQSRVLGRLAEACIDEQARETLEEHLDGVDTSAANCLASLRRLVNSIHRLRISTLDSFFAQVARAFSFELALPYGWSAMDPVQEPSIRMQAVASMLDTQNRKTLVHLVRMLAKGESSRRIADDVGRTVSAGYAVYRITDEKAWDQLDCPPGPSEQAVDSALQTLEGSRLNHKTADTQLQKLHQSARIGEWEQVVAHGIYKNLDAVDPTYYRRELLPSLVDALQLLAERAAAELLPIRRDQTKASYALLDAYDHEYNALLKKYRLLSFSDVTHWLSTWLSGSPNQSLNAQSAQQLAFRLDCGIHHLLLDEFQDTSPEQWRILRPLAQPLAVEDASQADAGVWIEADQVPHRSIFCVGDTKQAIYGWRGGVAEVFDSVTQAIPNIQQDKLTQSFRSSPAVMETVNQVFQNLPQHSAYGKSAEVASTWAQQFPEHTTARQQQPGYVRFQNGPKVDRQLTPNEKRDIFLGFTADQILELTAQTSASIGVLLRTNDHVGHMISMLRDRGVSASQDGGSALTDSVAVELILSLVHLADHPGDKIALFHVANSPLASALPGVSAAVGARQAAEVAEWFRTLVARQGLGRSIEQLAEPLATQLSWWDLSRVNQLIQLAHESRFARSGRLRDFEEMVEAQRVALPSEAQVKVMTIHRSKGLEFDAVFLPELGVELGDGTTLLVMRGEDPCAAPDGVLRYMNANLQSMLPESWQAAFRQNRNRAVRESLCMLYVAMTRARRALYLVGHPHGSSVQEFDSILQSTLAEKTQAKEECVTLFENGDPHWFADLPGVEQQTVEKQHVAETEQPLSIQLRRDPKSAPQRGLRVTAASFASHHSEPVALSDAFSYSQSIGVTYGKLIHRLLQEVRWLEAPRLPRRKLRQLALAAVPPEELQSVSVDRVLDEFEELLELASVKAALTQQRYRRSMFGRIPDRVEIDTERSLSVVVEGQLVVGSIDRLAILFHDGVPYGAEIVDFKTDAFDPDMTLLWLDDRIEHHRLQLEAYAEVVSKLYQLPRSNIQAHLVMLATDDFVQVPLRGLSANDRPKTRVRAPFLHRDSSGVTDPTTPT